MLNPKTNKRELAYIVDILETKELPNYTNVHYVKVLGWWCVSTKRLSVGDKAIYFEIDSILPREDKRFLFMEKRNYRVKTIRLCKVVSQGLVLPISDFPELSKLKVGEFVTDKLNVKLYDSENLRTPTLQRKDSFDKAKDRYPKFFKNPIIKLFMRCSFFRFIIKKIFIHKKDKISWPVWLPKTGSERIQNLPQLFDASTVTEVVGENEVEVKHPSSTTYIVEEKCVHRNTVIRTIEGNKRIGEIVNKKIDTLVASYNEDTESIEYKKILAYHKVRQDKSKDQYRIGILPVGRGNRQKYLSCTEDHRLLTSKGWLEASKIEVGDSIYHYVNKISHELKMLILGSLLGDANLTSKGTYVQVRFTNGDKQKEYFDFKKYIASGYITEERDHISGYGSLIHNFQLISNIWLNTYALENMVDSKGKLELRNSWLDEIDPIALAFWYMDDGSLNNREDDSLGEVISLHTQSYSQEECLLLQRMLKRFNIDSSLYTKDVYKGNLIKLNVENTKKFVSLIAPYVPSCMKYKLPKSYKDYPCVLQYKKYGFVNSIAETKVVSKEKLEKKETFMFDIEVEDNHNYFAQSILVHNCDGMSSSYILDEKDTYFVGSHNVIVYSSKDKDSKNIADGNKYVKNNVWVDMGVKYNMDSVLKQIKEKNKLKTVAIQGESYGSGIQKRTYSKKHGDQDLVVFHIWFDGKRLPVQDMIKVCDEYSLPHVHVFDWNYHIPSTVDEIIKDIDSKKSDIDDGDIEGFVFYSQDGQQNFKCVSPNYLLKYHQ